MSILVRGNLRGMPVTPQSSPPLADADASTPSLRTLGTSSTQAAAGNDARLPSSDQKAALAGTSGTPGASNKYVTDEDTRLDDVTAGGASGLMTGSDKSKLDGVAAGATATPLTANAPQPVGAAAVGNGTAAARDNHVHAMFKPVAVQAGDYSANWGEFVPVDASAAARTITLPESTGHAGEAIHVQRDATTTYAVNVVRSGSNTIGRGSATSISLTNPEQGLTFIADGAGKWYVF